MSLLILATLFASTAKAQLTTSIWMPGAANANQSFIGSIVAQQGDRTTISMDFAGNAIETEYYGKGPGNVTVGGTTYVAYQQTESDPGSDFVVTVGLACSRSDGSAAPVCAVTTENSGSESSLAAIYSSMFPQTITTITGDDKMFLNNYQLVITAGTEKIGASAAATPTGSGAQSTAAVVKSSAASSGVSQATGAAAPMLTMAPVLAGLGAAAAFFV